MRSTTLITKMTILALMKLTRLELATVLCLCLVGTNVVVGQQPEPDLFTYNELVQLYQSEIPPGHLQSKLDTLLTTPFLSNEAFERGVRPLVPSTAYLGRFIRVVQWNIERGLEYEAIKKVLGNDASLPNLLSAPRGSRARRAILREAGLLKQADIIILNEVDWGMKRTEYRNVAADLAAALSMNYAYGVEFVEVDPIALGIERFEELPDQERQDLIDAITVDQVHYKGLHGTAILSRFRLGNVRLRPFKNQPHDWYKDELKEVKPLEEGKRKAGQLVFAEKVSREIRRGGRMMLVAEIADPRIANGRATIVATHLESKTKPESRRKQLEELLEQIEDIDNPVIIAGDMNTSTQDATPTSITRELKKRLGSRSFWLEQGLKYLVGIKLPGLLLEGLNAYRKQADPTVQDIPLVAPNPEAEFFEKLKDFRFADGGAIDFRGERRRSVGHHTAPLANSNQRGEKGFLTTYEVERTIGFVGRFKLDWFFVKPPSLTEPYARHQPYRFAPHYGRTLETLNYSVKDRISDHNPILVDLPLNEPGKR